MKHAALSCLSLVALLSAGCSLLTENEWNDWRQARSLQEEGRHQEAAQLMCAVLQNHKNEQDPLLTEIRIAAAGSFLEMNNPSDIQKLLFPLHDAEGLTLQQQDTVRCLSGWAAVLKARQSTIRKETKASHIQTARKQFHLLLRRNPDSYRGRLGYALALYEAGGLYGTQTHLLHAHELLTQCATEKPDDPLLLFAYARTKQKLLGENTQEAVSLLKHAFERDRGTLEIEPAYREVFSEILRYPSITSCKAQPPSPEKKALLALYRKEMKASSGSPAAVGSFWNRVKTFLQRYEESIAVEEKFRSGIARAKKTLLEPDYSPLTAVQEALHILNETAAATSETIDAEKDPEFLAAKKEMLNGLLSALEEKVSSTIATDRIENALSSLDQAFRIISEEKDALDESIRWAQTFQRLKEQATGRQKFLQEKKRLREQLADLSPEEVRGKLKELKDRFRPCTGNRDFQELGDELLASQSVTFQNAITQAHQASDGREPGLERKALEKALELTGLPEFSHRRNEVLLLTAQSYFQEKLWAKTRDYIGKIPVDHRSQRAWLLLATVFTCEKRYDDAFRIFSRAAFSETISSENYCAAAGLVFAAKGKMLKAAPLLSSALNLPEARVPFPQETLIASLQESLIAVLEQEDAPTARETSIAERLIDSGRGSPLLARALGEWYLEEKKWERAYTYLGKAQQWGEEVSGRLLERLRVYLTDYCPLNTNFTWVYRQGDGRDLVLTVQEPLENGRFTVSITCGDAAATWQWLKQTKEKTLYKYFGEAFQNCHIMPVGLDTPDPASPLPSVKYKINGRLWEASVVKLDETVQAGEAAFEHCLLVETSQPGSALKVKHYLAPGKGEVKVVYPEGQESLNRTLVKFTDSALTETSL